MSTKDLYGIGKGDAQVVDLRPINAMVQNRQEEKRQRNAAKAKKRATNAAAINSQFDKVKNTSWSRDQKYISDLMDDTRSWMADTYAKYGEMSLVDNPELKREFDDRVGFIKRQNDASHANLAAAEKMLTRSQKNIDDIDEASGVEFNKWLDLSPAERLSGENPMPIIKDREMTLDEIVDRDAKSEIEGLQVPKGHTGIKNEETGRVTTYKGKTTDEGEYDVMIKDYNSNPNSSIFKYADREARKLINEDRYPPYITDEAGEQIQNPKYVEQLNNQREELIRQSFDKHRKKDYTTTTSTYKSTKGDDKAVVVTESAEGEKVSTTEKPLSDENIGKTFKDDSGKFFFETKVQTYRHNGKIYLEEELKKKGLETDSDDVEIISIGAVVDNDGHPRPDKKGLKEFTTKESTKVLRKGSVSSGKKPKTFILNKEVSNGKIKDTEDVSITGTIIGYEQVELDNGESEYIFQVSDKKGNITDVPATTSAKQAFPDAWKKIQESQGEEKQQSSAPKKGTVSGGYKFLGGNPNDQKNWKKV